MKKVSVLGTGAMGTAIARALLAHGDDVVVWNRTRTRAKALVGDGAMPVADLSEALRVSTTVLICVKDYTVTRDLLESVPGELLRGKTLVQLGTGTPEEARRAEAWLVERDAFYLDGVLLAGPMQVGGSDTLLLASGATRAFEAAKPMLEPLAAELIFLGEQVGHASTLEAAQVTWLLGAVVGFVQGSLICETEGFPVAGFGTAIAMSAPMIAEESKRLAEAISTGEFENPSDPLQYFTEAAERLVQHSREAKISETFPAYVLALLQRATREGHAQHHVGSLIESLRGGA